MSRTRFSTSVLDKLEPPLEMNGLFDLLRKTPMTYWLASKGGGQEKGVIKRFSPAYWTVNFPRPMMAGVVTTAPDALRVDAVFYGSGDLAGLIWEAEDVWDHPLLAYETSRDFRNCQLRFHWRSSGLKPLDTLYGPTLTIEGRDQGGNPKSWYVRLWNYASGSSEDADIVLDFNAMDGGYLLPAEADPVWAGDADRMFISLVAPGYDAATGGLTSIGPSAVSAIMGVAVTPPVTPSFAHVFDAVSAVEVDLLGDAMTLTNADDLALASGSNAALLGRELIQFGKATQTGPNRWRLERLMRGRRGTEWAMATHVIGENFLLLEQEALATVPSAYLQQGATLHMSAIGIGDLTPAQAQEMVLGQALVVPGPVHLQSHYDGSDWQFSWIRRSRIGWRWNDGADAPVAEEQELYHINLIHNGAIFRTAETAIAQWTYDAADIAADQSAGVSGSVTVEIRQIGTYGPGRPASLTITI